MHVREEGECGGISGEEEGNADYGVMAMVQQIQQHVAPCVKGVELGLGTIGLRILAAFWAGIMVEVTQEAGVVPRIRRAAIGTSFLSPQKTRRDTYARRIHPPALRGRQ